MPSMQSSYSEADDQLLVEPLSRRSLSVVTGSKLQMSGKVCVTLVKGSLVQQKVEVSIFQYFCVHQFLFYFKFAI